MTRLLIAVGAVAALAPSSTAQELTWAQNPSNGHWYGISFAEMTWFDAEAASVAQGGHLATLNDVAEAAWVQSAFAGYASSNYWIGLNDVASEGSFSWSSTEPSSFTDWAPGQPNDQFGIEDAVELVPGDGWRWNDANALDFASRRPLAETNDVPRFGWTLPEVYTTGDSPTHCFAAHIDGDSILDLAVLNAISETITLLRGTGNGAFVPLAAAPATTWPRSFTFGDFNQDQITDIALGGSTFYAVKYGLGSGVFVNGPSAGLGGAPYAVAAADLNGDARDDLVFGTLSTNAVRVVLANGSGGFAPSVGYAFAGEPAAVTIVDADGDLDLVVPSQTANTVRIFANDGGGAFTVASTFATGGRPARAVAADFDGDSRIDIAVPCGTLGRLHVHPGLGNGQFGNGYDVASVVNASSAELLDIEGDGSPDVAVSSFARGISLHRNRGGLLAGELVDAGAGLYGFEVADFDGDGRDDLAGTRNSEDRVVVLRRLSRDCNGNGTDDPRDIELGASIDANANGEPDECESVGTGFCFGDGTGAPCPCDPGQSGDAGSGCRNSSGTSAKLEASGVASVALDSVTLLTSGLPSSSIALVFQGNQAVNGGFGTPFGDGLRCVGDSVIRLVIRGVSNGSLTYGHGVVGDPSIAAQGQVPALGALRRYQVWYRDAQSYCTSATWNLSNGLLVSWTP